ncbi:HAD family hydrolase [Streptomyces buecherae]|uniref:HAD family hydrolase n=1 Tax=Streptomyces buecherae TaxID=2763006 RepID=UPI0037BBE8D5
MSTMSSHPHQPPQPSQHPQPAPRRADPRPGTGDAPPFLTVGFDLDMTLIDSRPGIKAAYQALAEETGTFIDADLAITRLGPPLEQELAHWFPDDQIQPVGDRYRALYPTHAITPTPALPGAREAIAAVRGYGTGPEADGADAGGAGAGAGSGRAGAARGRAIVVTAKHEPNAKLHLAHLGIEPDAVIGWLWAEAKAEALREYGASVYVGDHVGDVRGARTAGALAVAVATGPCDADELRAAGADVVLADLTLFPAWWRSYVSELA